MVAGITSADLDLSRFCEEDANIAGEKKVSRYPGKPIQSAVMKESAYKERPVE